MRWRVFVLLWVLGASVASGQTFLKQLNPGQTQVYSFSTGSTTATASMTVMWNRKTADLEVELYCGTEWDDVYPRRGRAVSTHDRMMRLDVGLEGGLDCRVYVDTNAVCAYAINFAWYGELTLTPTAFAVAPAEAALHGRPGDAAGRRAARASGAPRSSAWTPATSSVDAAPGSRASSPE